MTMRKLFSVLCSAGALLFAQQSLAQIEGTYVSDGEDGCNLEVTEVDVEEPRFGEAFYRFRSRGVAACMWDGIGISTSTTVAGAYVSLPPNDSRVFITMKLLYGPASPQIEIEQRNDDGTEILTQTYTRQ